MRLTPLSPRALCFFPAFLPLALAVSCTQTSAAAPQSAADLTSLSDEFDDPSSLSKWQRLEKVEGWNNDQLERFEIGRSQGGWLTMVPFTSTWYRDYRGILVFKPVTGDFVATTRLVVNRRGGTGAPRSQFSLAGIMVRAPRNVTPTTWREGGENYTFLSLGAADQPGSYQFEVKTTVNSDSQLAITPAPRGEAVIRVVKVGATMLMLKKVDGQWTMHRRYRRPDFPGTLQVGLTCYTDWPNASRVSAREHNGSVNRGGAPDLAAHFDYFRFAKPPAALSRGVDGMSDGEIIRALGD